MCVCVCACVVSICVCDCVDWLVWHDEYSINLKNGVYSTKVPISGNRHHVYRSVLILGGLE